MSTIRFLTPFLGPFLARVGLISTTSATMLFGCGYPTDSPAGQQKIENTGGRIYIAGGGDLTQMDSLSTFYDESIQRWGLKIDGGGVVIPAVYSDVTWIPKCKALIIERDDGTVQVYDECGRIVTSQVFTDWRYGGEEWLIVRKKIDGFRSATNYFHAADNAYYFDTWIDGQIYPFQEGWGRVRYESGGCRFFSTAGKSSPKYYDIQRFSEGLAAVKQEKHSAWMYVNENFDVVIEGKFDRANVFSEGLAAVVIDGGVGYINKQGDVVIPPRYQVAFSFQGGYAAVKTADGWVIIDKNGDHLTQATASDSVFFASTPHAQSNYFGTFPINRPDTEDFYLDRLDPFGLFRSDK